MNNTNDADPTVTSSPFVPTTSKFVLTNIDMERFLTMMKWAGVQDGMQDVNRFESNCSAYDRFVTFHTRAGSNMPTTVTVNTLDESTYKVEFSQSRYK